MITLKDITKENYNTYVGLLTEIQKDELVGQMYAPDSYFNPIQDNVDNWVISIEEMEYNINPLYSWVKDLDLIVYVPKENPLPLTDEN
jgi:hypothetical protein